MPAFQKPDDVISSAYFGLQRSIQGALILGHQCTIYKRYPYSVLGRGDVQSLKLTNVDQMSDGK